MININTFLYGMTKLKSNRSSFNRVGRNGRLRQSDGVDDTFTTILSPHQKKLMIHYISQIINGPVRKTKTLQKHKWHVRTPKKAFFCIKTEILKKLLLFVNILNLHSHVLEFSPLQK